LGSAIRDRKLKMSATIKTMDYVKVDTLNAGQLEIDDLIYVDGQVVNIVEIISLPEGYSIEIVDDYGDRDILFAGDFEQFALMMLAEDIE
jgi:hypothetical protein